MGNDLSLKEYPKDYIIVDIETTGLSPVKNEIIELSAIKFVNGKKVEEFSKLIKPKGTLSPFISKLTGITREMLADAHNLNETLSEFKKFCANNIIVGHNIKFDIRFIDLNMKNVLKMPFDNDYIDTLRLSRRFLPELKSHRLELLAQYYNIDNKGMHRALKDCHVTNICYENFIQCSNSY